MNVAIIGTVGIPANYGGFETLVEYLTKELGEKIPLVVYCSSKAYRKEELKDTHNSAELKYISLDANGLQSIFYDVLSLIKASFYSDTILILGVSGTIILPLFRKFYKGKIICNIDGLEHRRDKWNKWIKKFLKFSEKCAVKHSDIIIADNKAIQDYVFQEYGVPAVLIAYGGDHVNDYLTSVAVNEYEEQVYDREEVLVAYEGELENRHLNSREEKIKSHSFMENEAKEYDQESAFPLKRQKQLKKHVLSLEVKSKYNIPDEYAFKVCRIEPENNVEMILEAFSKATFSLVLVGNWDRSDFGLKMKEKYSSYENIILLDPIYDQDTLNQIRANALVYVHGHSAGGTNPSLVEAMCLGLPILAFDVVYNRETTLNQAFYFKDVEELAVYVNDLNPKYLKLIGQKMFEIANEEYSWKVIAQKYYSLFTS